MQVEVSGFDELLRKLTLMANTEELEGKALKAGAAETKKVLEAAAPVAPVNGGTLRANIVTTSIVNGKIEIGTKPTGDGFYGFFLEYGTSKMAARPWARPAFEQQKSSIKAVMADELRRGMGL